MPDAVSTEPRTVLVLGASGFIGSRVSRTLGSGASFRPLAASRRAGLTLDATDVRAVSAALPGMDCVVNCVAGSETTMVRATQALCDAARRYPPRRIVHLSSMAVYGAAVGDVDERTLPVPPLTRYGRAKLECERIVQQYVTDGGDAVILRPACVFGLASPQWTQRIANLLRARRIGDLGAAGDGYCNLTCVDDLVDGVLRVLSAPVVPGSVFNIASPADVTWNQFLVRFAIAIGATPVARISRRRFRVETSIVAPILKVGGRVAPLPDAITPSLAAIWRQAIRIDASTAARELGIARTPIERMIAAVAARPSREMDA